MNKPKTVTIASPDAFDRVITHILAVEGGCSDHASDRGGRTFKGITTARAKQNGWTSDVCSMSDETVRTIYRKDYWNTRAKNFAWPLNLAVMNTEVNSGGGRAQKILDLMKSKGVSGGLESQAKWYVDQQTAYYHEIVARNSSQKVFLKGWLNRSTYMLDVIAARLSLTYAEAPPEMPIHHSAKAYDEKE